MKRVLLLCVLLFCLFYLTTPANAANVSATSCSQSHVQAAINSASNGDTVIVPSGTCSWTTQVSVPNSKGITLQGAGPGGTNITNGGVTSQDLLSVNVAAGNALTRITGFSFSAGSVSTTSALVGIVGSGLDRFRVDHCTFTIAGSAQSRGVKVSSGGLEIGGVIDNNIFNKSTSASVQSVSVFGAGAGVHTPFSRGYTPGTNRAVYIEDNEFNYTNSYSDGALDSYGGARVVFRFNEVKGTFWGGHGADSGGYRGTLMRENYHNTGVSTNTGNLPWLHRWRGGSGFDFNNVWSGSYNSGIPLVNYRSLQSYAPFGTCSGSSSYDKNTPGQNGWPCLDQIGHIFTDDPVGDKGASTLVGLYLWGNYKDGALQNGYLFDTGGQMPSHVVANRDFYNHNTSFTGSTGIGVGTLAARPTACTAGVGYWATDQGEWNSLRPGADGQLYRCTTTNTWALYYKPYAYPHPLQGGAPTASPPPSSPTNLVIRP